VEAAVEEVIAVSIPIFLFLAIAVVVSVYLYIRYRTQREVLVTVRQAIERGQELTPELLERLGQTPRGKDADLRRGVIAVALGVALALFGQLVGQEEARQPLLAIGAIPLLVGLAYLGLWRFGNRP